MEKLKNPFPHFFNISSTISTYCEIEICSHTKYTVIDMMHMSITAAFKVLNLVQQKFSSWPQICLKQLTY